MIGIEMIDIPAGGGCDAFRIGKYPVTVGEWNAVMPDNPRIGDDRHPVTSVDVGDITAFLNALNAATGQEYRLPTEIEWCWACGREPENLADYAVYGVSFVVAVGTKLPNEYGVFDMRGLVWEWMTTGRDSAPHVLRGGSFAYSNVVARAVCRVGRQPAFRYLDRGFRLFCVLRPPSL